jgi:hypothetical protein
METRPSFRQWGIPKQFHAPNHNQFGFNGFKLPWLMPIKLTIMSQNTSTPANKSGPVMGYDIPRVLPTPWGVFWTFVYLIFPVLLLGNLIDLAFQFFLGWCIGIWCVFPS